MFAFQDQKVDVVCEILKALFNLTLNSYGSNDDKKEDEQCEHLVKLLRMYILIPTSNKEKTVVLQSNIINLLTNIPNEYYKMLVTPVQPEQDILKKFQFDGQNMTAFYEILVFLNDQFTVTPVIIEKTVDPIFQCFNVGRLQTVRNFTTGSHRVAKIGH
jgi:hypothetical protein